MSTFEKTNILGSEISVWDLDETVSKLVEFIRKKEKHYVCVSNVHTVVMGLEDPSFANVTNSAGLATADGVPLVWASKVLNGPKIHGRANGPDVLEKMIEDQSLNDLKHYFYGSTPKVLDALKGKLLEKNKDSKLEGFFSPPIRAIVKPSDPLTADELEDCKKINDANPDIVWVGLGAPKQEIWMYRVRKHLNAPVLIGVGAAFDLIAGTKPRAPRWMQRNGLEWFHRLMSEPKRLRGRYMSTNPKFIAEVVKQAVLGKSR